MSSEALERTERIRENILHVARGCSSAGSHNPAPYLNSIEAALVALLAEVARLEQAATEARYRYQDNLAASFRERDSLAAALAEARERAEKAEQERDEAQRESDDQMGQKLAAQVTLKTVCDVLNLPMVSLGNGWTEATPKILARIETIVDEADRGFRERDKALAALAVAREREQRLRGEIRRFIATEYPDGTEHAADSAADRLARAALVDEPAAAPLTEQAYYADDEGRFPEAEAVGLSTPFDRTHAAADEPGETP